MSYDQNLIAFIGMPGTWELIVIAMVGLLIFGNRLPEVGKGLGRGIVEFKKGLKSINEDIEDASSKSDKENSKS